MKVSRRKLVTGGAALIAVSAASAAGAATPAKGKSATYVLVHGGGHGGWCWERVAAPLRAMGHRVLAPSLTGLADRSHLISPQVDLEMHIADITNLIRWEDLRNVILVGHSYGGMVIPGVADRSLDRVAQLVFLDAAHPKNGESLWSKDSPNVKSAKIVGGVPIATMPSADHVRSSYGVTDPADVAWMMERLTPHPLNTFTQPLQLKNEAAVKAIPTTDIWRSTVLKRLDPDGSKRATMATRVWEIETSAHDLMITHPKEVTEMLARLAAL